MSNVMILSGPLQPVGMALRIESCSDSEGLGLQFGGCEHKEPRKRTERSFPNVSLDGLRAGGEENIGVYLACRR